MILFNLILKPLFKSIRNLLLTLFFFFANMICEAKDTKATGGSGTAFEPTIHYFTHNIVNIQSYQVIAKVVTIMAMFLLLIIFAIKLVSATMKGISATKDSIPKLFLRLAIAGILISVTPHLADAVMNIGNEAYKGVYRISTNRVLSENGTVDESNATKNGLSNSKAAATINTGNEDNGSDGKLFNQMTSVAQDSDASEDKGTAEEIAGDNSFNMLGLDKSDLDGSNKEANGTDETKKADTNNKAVGAIMDGAHGLATFFVFAGHPGLLLTLLFLEFTVELIMLGLMCYWYLKLSIEVIKHYVTMCILYTFAPISAAFVTSDDTQQVFTAYWKMFGSEIAMLILTRMWCWMSMGVCYNVDCSVVGVFCAIAFMQAGMQLSTWMGQLGLGTANSGANLMDSVRTAFNGLTFAANTMGKIAGFDAHGAGVITKNAGLTSLGNALRHRDPSISKAQDDIANPGIIGGFGQGVYEAGKDVTKSVGEKTQKAAEKFANTKAGKAVTNAANTAANTAKKAGEKVAGTKVGAATMGASKKVANAATNATKAVHNSRAMQGARRAMLNKTPVGAAINMLRQNGIAKSHEAAKIWNQSTPEDKQKLLQALTGEDGLYSEIANSLAEQGKTLSFDDYDPDRGFHYQITNDEADEANRVENTGYVSDMASDSDSVQFMADNGDKQYFNADDKAKFGSEYNSSAAGRPLGLTEFPEKITDKDGNEVTATIGGDQPLAGEIANHVKLADFVQGGDVNASHYRIRNNGNGCRTIEYYGGKTNTVAKGGESGYGTTSQEKVWSTVGSVVTGRDGGSYHTPDVFNNATESAGERKEELARDLNNASGFGWHIKNSDGTITPITAANIQDFVHRESKSDGGTRTTFATILPTEAGKTYDKNNTPVFENDLGDTCSEIRITDGAQMLGTGGTSTASGIFTRGSGKSGTYAYKTYGRDFGSAPKKASTGNGGSDGDVNNDSSGSDGSSAGGSEFGRKDDGNGKRNDEKLSGGEGSDESGGSDASPIGDGPALERKDDDYSGGRRTEEVIKFDADRFDAEISQENEKKEELPPIKDRIEDIAENSHSIPDAFEELVRDEGYSAEELMTEAQKSGHFNNDVLEKIREVLGSYDQPDPVNVGDNKDDDNEFKAV